MQRCVESSSCECPVLLQRSGRHVQRCVDAATFTYRSDERELKVEITVDEVFEFERSPTHLPHLTRARAGRVRTTIPLHVV